MHCPLFLDHAALPTPTSYSVQQYPTTPCAYTNLDKCFKSFGGTVRTLWPFRPKTSLPNYGGLAFNVGGVKPRLLQPHLVLAWFLDFNGARDTDVLG